MKLNIAVTLLVGAMISSQAFAMGKKKPNYESFSFPTQCQLALYDKYDIVPPEVARACDKIDSAPKLRALQFMINNAREIPMESILVVADFTLGTQGGCVGHLMEHYVQIPVDAIRACEVITTGFAVHCVEQMTETKGDITTGAIRACASIDSEQALACTGALFAKKRYIQVASIEQCGKGL